MTRFSVPAGRRLALLAFLIGASTSCLGQLHAQPGSLDPAFRMELTAINAITAVALQREDGKWVVGGRYYGRYGSSVAAQAFVARLQANGDFDSSFQPVLDEVGGWFTSLLVQPDGKVIAGGDGLFKSYVGGKLHGRGLARFNADGSADASFDAEPGIQGSWTTALQADGKIVLGGDFIVSGVSRRHLARLNADGSLDTVFPRGIDVQTPVTEVLALNDGRMLMIGGVDDGDWSLGVGRLNADGALDHTFRPALSTGEAASTMALQSDGRIVLGGTVVGYNAGRALTRRLNADGSLDPGFIPAFNDSASEAISGLAVQEDGKILVYGAFSTLNGLPFRNVARLNPDGTVDGNFDPGMAAAGTVTQGLLDKNGNCVMCGNFTNSMPTSYMIKILGGEPAPGAPVFKSQPLPAAFNQGAIVTLTPLIAAFPLPGYQWQFNGHDLPGATHSTLVLTNVDPSMAGSYQLQVSNALGTATSEPVKLASPEIVVQPLPQTVYEGQDAVFSVSATNFLPLSFQWQFEGMNVLGATNTTLGLSGVRSNQAGLYAVTVSDAVGSVASAPALLAVLQSVPPQILSQPRSQTIEIGAEVSFSVVATNYLPLTYQWQLNGTNIAGATQPTLTLVSAQGGDGGAYTVLVSSEFLTAGSQPATLTLMPVEYVPGPGVVTNLDQGSLEAAVRQGVTVTFGINGIIPLTNMLVIAQDTTLDGTHRSVRLDGQNSIRHFAVTNRATLRLINLTLTNGQYVGAKGQDGQTGEVGLGGLSTIPAAN